MRPVVLTNMSTSMDLYRQESFGPSVSWFTFETEDEAIKLANGTDYRLSASIYTEDLGTAFRVAEQLDSGAVHINSITVHDEFGLPHGGVKKSGSGRFNGYQGLDEFLYCKTVTWMDFNLARSKLLDHAPSLVKTVEYWYSKQTSSNNCILSAADKEDLIVANLAIAVALCVESTLPGSESLRIAETLYLSCRELINAKIVSPLPTIKYIVTIFLVGLLNYYKNIPRYAWRMCGLAGRTFMESSLHNNNVLRHAVKTEADLEEHAIIVSTIQVLNRQWSASTGLPTNFSNWEFDTKLRQRQLKNPYLRAITAFTAISDKFSEPIIRGAKETCCEDNDDFEFMNFQIEQWRKKSVGKFDFGPLQNMEHANATIPPAWAMLLHLRAHAVRGILRRPFFFPNVPSAVSQRSIEPGIELVNCIVDTLTRLNWYTDVYQKQHPPFQHILAAGCALLFLMLAYVQGNRDNVNDALPSNFFEQAKRNFENAYLLSTMSTQSGWRALDVAVIGGGIGGQAVATSIRRQGHKVTIYADFAGEVGASISCAANGTRWLEEWKVNIEIGNLITLRKLISRDWKTGEPISVYDLKDYKERWGYVYYMFHRQYMHRMLMDSPLGEGEGPPAQLIVKHQATGVDAESGEVTFANGKKVKHDVVIGADGIGCTPRSVFGIKPDRKPTTCTCLHTNVDTAKAVELGLIEYSQNSALEYWGGYNTHFKIVLSPCNGGKLLSYYCFFPREAGDLKAQTWDQEATLEELLDPYPDLDRAVFKHLEIGYEIRPWRLRLHELCDHWTEGVACIMGDAAHPMMPDQSQGACQAIEDAAAIGLVFSKKHFNGDIRESLKIFEEVRKPRATKAQAASARARENINERIDFSSNTNAKVYNVATEDGKLTIDEMNMYNMKDHVANIINERRLEGNIKSESKDEDHNISAS
ncbi:salicylate 1-monooxygenase [Fusarium bulbicola]|nr:salicylate 1-monooxygenase [Fusarium bulbicola]